MQELFLQNLQQIALAESGFQTICRNEILSNKYLSMVIITTLIVSNLYVSLKNENNFYLFKNN